MKIKINDKKIYSGEKYDTTIIEIKEEKINNYFELDKNIIKDTLNIYNENIYSSISNISIRSTQSLCINWKKGNPR